MFKNKEYIRALTPRELILILVVASMLELHGIRHYFSISWPFTISIYINILIGIFGSELGFSVFYSEHPLVAYAIIFTGLIILFATIGVAAYGAYILFLQIVMAVSAVA